MWVSSWSAACPPPLTKRNILTHLLSCFSIAILPSHALRAATSAAICWSVHFMLLLRGALNADLLLFCVLTATLLLAAHELFFFLQSQNVHLAATTIRLWSYDHLRGALSLFLVMSVIQIVVTEWRHWNGDCCKIELTAAAIDSYKCDALNPELVQLVVAWGEYKDFFSSDLQFMT